MSRARKSRKNPAVDAAQYRLAQAVLHGTARTKTSMSKAAAKELIEKTPARLRSQFMKSNAGKKSWRKTKKAAHKRLGLQRKKNPARRNPEEIAAEAYREFHGKDPEKVFDVDTRMHYHSVLAGMARLKFIDVKRADGGITTIHFDKNTHLAENEHQTQLFIVGGDQSVNLKDFGISVPHEMQVLGKAVEIGYFTDKKHLISKDGGKGTYVHPFGYTRNGNGREVKVKQSDPPTLIYDTRNKLLSFAGGSYTIKPEGIDG
jgi:hypothetical protein